MVTKRRTITSGSRPIISQDSYAPNPSVPNPFRELRINDTTKPSMESLAAKAGISKQALIRLEQATYVEPLPTAVHFYASHYAVTEYELINDYEAYQHAVRELNPRYFGDIKGILNDTPVSVHPFVALRGRRTPTEVAKNLCIPQSTIVYFESKALRQKSVPKGILNALRDVGHFKSETDALEVAYEQHRNYLRMNKVNSTLGDLVHD